MSNTRERVIAVMGKLERIESILDNQAAGFADQLYDLSDFVKHDLPDLIDELNEIQAELITDEEEIA